MHAQTIQRRPALHGHPGVRDISDADRAVQRSVEGVGKISADLRSIHIKRRDELHIADVVITQLGVHEARDFLVDGGIAVKLHALHQGSSAVTDTGDGHTNFRHYGVLLSLASPG